MNKRRPPTGRHSVLPLKNDTSGAFLPWLIAPMVLLCALAIAAVFILNSLIGRWERDLVGTITVEIAAAPGDAQKSSKETWRRSETAIALLKETPGILSAQTLDRERVAALLEPWLGGSDLLAELPLPMLIDVAVDPQNMPDLTALSARIATAVPGVSIDDHRLWFSKLTGLSRRIEWLALSTALLIAAVTSTMVVFATHTGMAIHRETVRLLHQIGATDDYIAREFARHAALLGLKGGLMGLVPTIPLMIAIETVSARMESGFVAGLSLPWLGWAVVLTLPLLTAALAMLTARLTVHRVLTRMI